MTVSIAATSKKYRGRKAATYEAVRKKQSRWHRENELVENMLDDWHTRSRVLDIPVGTGRFFEFYQRMNLDVVGIDVSEDMLALARKKKAKVNLKLGSALEISEKDNSFDVSVCVRFLDLIDEEAMRTVMKELFRVTKHQIILTIRFGPKYVPKSNTAEHDERKFKSLVTRSGWRILRSEPIRDAGWHVLSLTRRSNGR